MDETTEKCPICLEDFNTDDPDKTPYRICNKSHFICKGCIKPFIEIHYTNYSSLSITTHTNNTSIKLVYKYDRIGENSLPPCIKCPMCRNPIKYDFKKLRRNNQSRGVENTFTFYRCRYFEEVMVLRRAKHTRPNGIDSLLFSYILILCSIKKDDPSQKVSDKTISQIKM